MNQLYRLYEQLKYALRALSEILPSLFPRPDYEEPIEENPMNTDPVPPSPIPPPPVPPPPAPKYLWDTPEHARHSVRVICDEEGLTVRQKNDLCATVACESGFRPKAINVNRDKNGLALSTDYGICQINSYWHIGPGKSFPSAQYVFDHPEACIRWMCKMFRAGKMNLWVCYSKGMYKKYL